MIDERTCFYLCEFFRNGKMRNEHVSGSSKESVLRDKMTCGMMVTDWVHHLVADAG